MGMSREEAIKIIRKMLAYTDLTVRSNLNADMVSACNFAIKALEQEPTTKNDLGVDCVSRVDVLKLMQDNWHTHNGDWAMQESMDDIRALPTVTPQEPRKGHWITRPHVYGVTYCSECDFELKIDNTNYCPNCGAKMVEPQKSEG